MNIQYKKIIFTIVSIFAIVGYGYFAFASAPLGGYTAGSTLDPDCAPGDTDCIVALITGVSIGDTIGNSPDLNGILYTNTSGQITTDSLFTRNTTTKATSILRSDNASYNTYTYTTAQLLALDDSGLVGSYIVGETVTGGTSGTTGVVSKVLGPGTLLLSSSTGTFDPGENVTGGTSGATGGLVDFAPPSNFSNGNTFIVFDFNTNLPTGVTGTITNISGNTITVSATGVINENNALLDDYPSLTKILMVHTVNTIAGSLSFSTGFQTNSDINGSGLDGSAITMTDGVSTIGLGTFSDGLGAIRSGWFTDAVINFLPGSAGTAGQALVTNGSGDLSWGTISSPISIGSTGNTLYSSGLTGTGQGYTTGGLGYNIFFGEDAGINANSTVYSNFLGYGAGANATQASGSNFFGYDAGNAATNAYQSNFFGRLSGNAASAANNSNFFGYEAGSGSNNAYRSNFFGIAAGSLATNANNANFFGANSGYQAVNAANSIFIGQEAGTIATNASNSIFLGKQSGVSDTVDNTTSSNDFSILIGPETSTGGFSNSIAIGSQANNTASNQFMIGSTTRTIDTTVWNGSASTTCTLTTGTGIACSSDERLKTNITDLNADTLDKLLNLKTVSYNWIQNPESKTQIGFLAQDLEQYFPELVNTDLKGMKSVYYAQMTPILVEAIRAMNLKITEINIIEKPNTWRDSLIAWFANTANGITEFIAGTLRAKDQLCVGQTCVTESQLQQLLNGQGIQQAPAPTPAPTPEPTPDTTVESESVDTEITRETDTTPPDNNETITEDTDTTTDEPIITPEPETITSSEETPPIDVVTE